MSTTTERIKEFSKQGVGYQISVTFSDMGRMAELLERADEIIAMSLPMTERYGGREWLADFAKFQEGKDG